MPVQKFHSIEEMNRATVRVPQGSAFERFVRHCRRYRLISKPAHPRGVFKFRTIEEAQAERARVAAESHHLQRGL